jgi:hypothetical protein
MGAYQVPLLPSPASEIAAREKIVVGSKERNTVRTRCGVGGDRSSLPRSRSRRNWLLLRNCSGLVCQLNACCRRFVTINFGWQTIGCWEINPGSGDDEKGRFAPWFSEGIAGSGCGGRISYDSAGVCFWADGAEQPHPGRRDRSRPHLAGA